MNSLSIVVGLGMFFYYYLFSVILQFQYYYRSASKPAAWKTQSHRLELLGRIAALPWIPILEPFGAGKRPGRHPDHWLFATLNISSASIIAAVITELVITGTSKLYFEWPSESYSSWSGGLTVFGEMLLILLHLNVLEYYWHRMMHLPWCYRRMHKLHHFYKSPVPFDDMFIHPVEAIGFYVILSTVPLIYRVHILAFAGYMIVAGVTGVTDHSGIKLSVPGIYSSEDHDTHHSRFAVNYAFPFPFMDVLHGTYRGTWLGREFGRHLGPALKDSDSGETAPVAAAAAASAATSDAQNACIKHRSGGRREQ